MILDIIILGILIVSILLGRKNGCLKTLIRLCAIAGGVVAGVVFAGPLSEFLSYTPIETFIVERITNLVSSESIDLVGILPAFIENSLQTVVLETQTQLVLMFVRVSMTILSFLIIVIVAWIIALWLLNMIKRSRRSKGLIGSVDSFLGIFFGALRGVIIIMLLLASIVPLCGVFAPEHLTYIGNLLDSSIIAGWIYDINPIISFVNKLL